MYTYTYIYTYVCACVCMALWNNNNNKVLPLLTDDDCVFSNLEDWQAGDKCYTATLKSHDTSALTTSYYGSDEYCTLTQKIYLCIYCPSCHHDKVIRDGGFIRLNKNGGRVPPSDCRGQYCMSLMRNCALQIRGNAVSCKESALTWDND